MRDELVRVGKGKKLKKRPLLVIEWLDAAGSHTWRDEKNVIEEKEEDDGLAHTFCVGWKLKSNRKTITVAATRNVWDDCNDRETIPRNCIKSIRRLE